MSDSFGWVRGLVDAGTLVVGAPVVGAALITAAVIGLEDTALERFVLRAMGRPDRAGT